MTTPKPKCRTTWCKGDPTAPGAANGDCPRCYQRERRDLPRTASNARDQERTERVPFYTTPARKRAAVKLARSTKTPEHPNGMGLGAWLDQLLVKVTGVR